MASLKRESALVCVLPQVMIIVGVSGYITAADGDFRSQVSSQTLATTDFVVDGDHSACSDNDCATNSASTPFCSLAKGFSCVNALPPSIPGSLLIKPNGSSYSVGSQLLLQHSGIDADNRFVMYADEPGVVIRQPGDANQPLFFVSADFVAIANLRFDIAVTNSTTTNNIGLKFYKANANDYAIKGLRFINNEVYFTGTSDSPNASRIALRAFGLRNSEIIDNTFRGFTKGERRAGGGVWIACRNRYNASANALQFYEAYGNTVYNNTFEGFNGKALHVGCSADYPAGSESVWMTVVKHNTFADNHIGIDSWLGLSKFSDNRYQNNDTCLELDASHAEVNQERFDGCDVGIMVRAENGNEIPTGRVITFNSSGEYTILADSPSVKYIYETLSKAIVLRNNQEWSRLISWQGKNSADGPVIDIKVEPAFSSIAEGDYIEVHPLMHDISISDSQFRNIREYGIVTSWKDTYVSGVY